MRKLELRLNRDMFPYLLGRPEINLKRLEILFEAPGAVLSAHKRLEFLPGGRAETFEEELEEGDVEGIECIASAEWPQLYHGSVEVGMRIPPFISAFRLVQGPVE